MKKLMLVLCLSLILLCNSGCMYVVGVYAGGVVASLAFAPRNGCHDESTVVDVNEP